MQGAHSLKRLVEITYKSGLRNSNGRKAYKSRIAELLADPFYIGKIRYRGIVHPGAHEPLISYELFSRVQQMLKQKGAPKYRKHFPLFKSLIQCSACGGSITWEVQKGHWYGHCNGYRNCTNGPKRKFVRQEYVEEQLLPYFEIITIKSDRLLEWIKKALKESHQDEIAYNSSVREELNKRYEAVQKRLDTLYDDKADGKIPEDLYQRKFTQYTNEKEEILANLKRHDTANTKYYELGSNMLDLAHRAKEIYLSEKRTVEEKRTLLSLIFSNLALNSDKLSVSYTKAFQFLADYVPVWNEKFEPQNFGSITAQSDLYGVGLRSLLPRQDDFRTIKAIRWEELFDFPEVGLAQIRQLLAVV